MALKISELPPIKLKSMEIEVLIEEKAYDNPRLMDRGIAWIRLERFTHGTSVTLRAAYAILENIATTSRIDKVYDIRQTSSTEIALLAHEMGAWVYNDSRLAISDARKKHMKQKGV